MSPKKCPDLSVDIGPAMDDLKVRLKEELKREMGMENAPTVHRLAGLPIRFLPTQFKGGHFAAGAMTIPHVLNIVARVAEKPGFITNAGISRAVVLGGGTLLTLGIHLFTGGNSFTLGALVGEANIALDAAAKEVADWIGGARHRVATEPAPGPHGISMGAERDEISRLRNELDRLSGLGDSAEGNAAGSQGVGNVMVVNGR